MKKSLLFLLFFALAPALHALTVSELKVQIRRGADDVPNPQVRYTDAFLLDILNEAHRDFVNQTWALMIQDSQSLSGSTTYYSMRDDAFAIRMVRYRTTAGVVRELTEISEKALIQENPDYERQAGAPDRYFVRYSTSGASAMEIGFTPRPNVAGTVLVDYYIQAPALDSNDDIPFAGYRILYPYHEALSHYVIGRLKQLEGDAAGAGYHTQLYINAVKTANDRLGRMPNYTPGFGGGK